jgi:hypothetical protein
MQIRVTPTHTIKYVCKTRFTSLYYEDQDILLFSCFKISIVFTIEYILHSVLMLNFPFHLKSRYIFCGVKICHVSSLGNYLTFWHRSFTFNSNISPTCCNNFSVYYRDVCLQLNMFRAFSRPPSGAQ